MVAQIMTTAFLATLAWLNWPVEAQPVQPMLLNEAPAADGSPVVARTFSACHFGGGRNCVVDGDTFWIDGEKIRIANIDTPETHPPRCAAEAERGAAATRRLHALLSAGAISLHASGLRSHDRYGRRLATVSVNGADVGQVLIREGLARAYGGGPRAGWCSGGRTGQTPPKQLVFAGQLA